MSLSLRLRLVAVACLLSLCVPSARGQGEPPTYNRRWVYSSSYLANNADADSLIALINRASASGYNGLVLTDWGFHSLAEMPPSYFQNVSRVVDAAKAAGVEIIPSVFPVGYSEGLLKHDPNLAEGVPVNRMPFTVQQGVATPANANVNRIVNGNFEVTSGTKFPGFTFQDDGVSPDHEVVFEGTTSLHAQGDGWMSRIYQVVPVRPWTSYRLSAWVKTSTIQPNANMFYFYAMGPDWVLLNHEAALVAPTQDWTYVSVVFNSLHNTNVSVYSGLWFTWPGSHLWMDDLRLEEIGPTNILRRSGCPLRVTSADGRTNYVEGVDFQPLVDPLLGQQPWAGNYSYNHDAPQLRLTPQSRIKNGQTLLVSWYHPIIIYGYQVTCCLNEPKVFDLMKDQARRVINLLKPKTMMMMHDEIRVANWCARCQGSGGGAGDLLARHIKRAARIIRDIDSTVQVAVWSDMFDPFHNAVGSYYLVNGDLEGSWEGLDPDFTVVNWNGGYAASSVAFFSELEVRQVLAGYYDSQSLDNFFMWDQAATGIPGVNGFMFTTWWNDFTWLEPYGKAMRRQP